MASHAEIARYIKHPERAPKTRRELLWFLWEHFDAYIDVFKEGPFYALRVGRIISATHVRRIDTRSKEAWLQLAKGVPT